MLSNSTHVLAKLPRPLARQSKFALAYPRFYANLYRARLAYKKHGERYRFPLLFIAGMPKSGSSWLSELIKSCTEHIELLPPEATFAELQTGQSITFDLSKRSLLRLKNALVFTKMHCHGSPTNVTVLRDASAPYVILYRDPRAVALSYVHYVSCTPWHAEHPTYKSLSAEAGISMFLNKHLATYAHWLRSWRDNRCRTSSIMLSYENLRDQPLQELKKVLSHFGLSLPEDHIEEALDSNSIGNLRKRMPKIASFFREGSNNGWRKFFKDKHHALLDSIDATILKEFGY